MIQTKTILSFVSGIVVGGIIGTLIAKRYFKNQCAVCLSSQEENYCKNDIAVTSEIYKNIIKENNYINDENDEDAPVNGRMSLEERKDIKEKLTKNWEGTTNYAHMYKRQDNDTSEKEETAKSRLDDQKMDEDDEETEGTPEEEAYENHQKNKNRSPKIISLETYESLPAHIDQETLYFYSYDEVLCDDNEEMIEDPDLLIGDALTKYDFIDNKERIMFVMNYAQDTCYEIQKVDASWSDSH